MSDGAHNTPVEAFLEQYFKDREAGSVQDLDAYLAAFPGDSAGVAAEYLALQSRATPVEPSGGSLGPYKLEEELGRGGQGVVYKATDTRIGRTVALKVLRGLGPAADDLLVRFKREATAASKTDHPGVCAVYDAEVEGGIPYIAMRYIEGETLARRIASTREGTAADIPTTVVTLDEVSLADDPDTSADHGTTSSGSQSRSDIMRVVYLVEKTARALHAVHEAGVIHRDVKPGNVMITPQGDAVVMDFGLARDEDSDLQTLTRSGDFFGTPAYMSPEQLTRHNIRLDRRTDVWSLGVMLYECVTLKRPFDAPSREGLYQQILAKEPEAPRRLNPSIPNDLATVIATAIDKDRDRRYQTALDLAEDLRRVRSYEPIEAKPVGQLTRLVRWAQRNPAVASLTAALFISMSVGLVWIWLQNQSLLFTTQEAHANAERAQQNAAALASSNEELARKTEEAEANATALAVSDKELAGKTEEAEANATALEVSNQELAGKVEEEGRRSYASNLKAAQVALSAGDRAEAWRFHALCPEPYRNWEWYHLALSLDQSLQTLQGHTRMVSSVSWSPDGTRIVSGSSDNTLRIWDAASGESLQTLGPDEGIARFLNFFNQTSIHAVAWSPDGTRIVSGSDDTTLSIWDAVSGKSLATLEGHEAPVTCVSWSPDGTRIVSGSIDNTLCIWDAVSGKVLQTLQGDAGHVGSVAWSPDGRRIVVSRPYARTLRIWDATTGEPVQTLKGHEDGVLAVAWSLDGTRIVSGSKGPYHQTLRIWDATTGETVQTLEGHRGEVTSVSWSPDGTRVVSGSSDETLRIWDAASGESLTTLEGHRGEVTSVFWSPDGKRVVSGSYDRTLRIWDAVSGKNRQTLGQGGHVAWSPDGTRFVSAPVVWAPFADREKAMRIWDAATGEILQTLVGHGSAVSSVSWSPDGTRIVSCSGPLSVSIVDKEVRWDGTLRIWDAATGETLQTLQGRAGPMTSVSWSPDGTRIVAGSGAGTLSIWDAARGAHLKTLATRALPRTRAGQLLGFVHTVCWSPDGTRILSARWSASALSGLRPRIWDAASGKRLQTLVGHRDDVTSLSWSPDGTRIVSGSSDNTLRIWDAASGKALQTLVGHGDDVRAVAWSPDGKRIVSGSDDGTLHIWDAVLGQSLQILVGHGSPVSSLSWSPDGARIISSSGDNVLHIYESRLEDALPMWRAADQRRRAQAASAAPKKGK